MEHHKHTSNVNSRIHSIEIRAKSLKIYLFYSQEVCPEGVEPDIENECPAVIVEQVNSAEVEQCYAAQVLVYDDQNTYMVQDVAEEQVVETELQEMEEGKHRIHKLPSKTCTAWCISVLMICVLCLVR